MMYRHTPRRRRIVGSVPLVVLLAGSLLAGCSPADEATESTTTTTPSTSTTSTTQTSSTSTTTSLPAMTTTVAPTTPTTSTSNTTTTVAETTTTSDAVGTVELTNEGIYAGDSWLYFGYDADEAIAAVETVLGPAMDDSGWLDSLTDGWEHFGVCPSPNVRGVSWGEGGIVSLQLLFTDANTDFWSEGVQHFFSYYYSGAAVPTDLSTPEGVGIGSTLGDLQAAYGPGDISIDEAFFDPSEGFWSYRMATWTGLWGYATGLDDTDTITSMNGGQGCGE